MSNQIISLIDSFISEIKKNPGIEIQEVSDKLQVDLEYIERWILILEEKEVLDIKNVGFKSYLYLKEHNSNTFDFSFFKEEFIQKAKNKNIPYENLEEVWKRFLNVNESFLIGKFMEKGKRETSHTNTDLTYAWSNFRKEYEVL